MMPVYICSPYRGDVKWNIRIAKGWSRVAYKLGYLPLCVHIYLENATGLKENWGDREKLLDLGIKVLSLAKECWICTEYISEGMKEEIKFAKEKGIKIRKIWKEEIKVKK